MPLVSPPHNAAEEDAHGKQPPVATPGGPKVPNGHPVHRPWWLGATDIHRSCSDQLSSGGTSVVFWSVPLAISAITVCRRSGGMGSGVSTDKFKHDSCAGGTTVVRVVACALIHVLRCSCACVYKSSWLISHRP